MIIIYNLVKVVYVDKIINNINVIRYKTNRKIMFVCKGEFYGFGVRLAKLIERYVDCFAVFSLEEGTILREIGIAKPILILQSNACEIEDYIRYNFDINLYKVNDLMVANNILAKHNKILNLHLPINTGMNRLGVDSYIEAFDTINVIKNLKNIKLTNIYTHFYEDNIVNIMMQYNMLSDIVNLAKKQYNNLSCHYISSSYIKYDFNKITNNEYVRIGIANYANTIKSTINTFDLYSKIIDIKNIKKGEVLGYNHKFIAKKNIKVAVCSGGYYDGILDSFTGKYVKINDKYNRIISNSCMDVFFVDITDNACEIGDNVTIISANDDKLSYDRLVNNSYQSHSILTNLTGRVKTIYK